MNILCSFHFNMFHKAIPILQAHHFAFNQICITFFSYTFSQSFITLWNLQIPSSVFYQPQTANISNTSYFQHSNNYTTILFKLFLTFLTITSHYKLYQSQGKQSTYLSYSIWKHWKRQKIFNCLSEVYHLVKEKTNKVLGYTVSYECNRRKRNENVEVQGNMYQNRENKS